MITVLEEMDTCLDGLKIKVPILNSLKIVVIIENSEHGVCILSTSVRSYLNRVKPKHGYFCNKKLARKYVHNSVLTQGRVVYLWMFLLRQLMETGARG